jgi:hypothetical protein
MADTATNLAIAVAVLYVAVVLMAARFLRPRGVLYVALGCVALTILSFYLTLPAGPTPTGIMNMFISISAIGLTTFLAYKANQQKRRFTSGPSSSTFRVTR